MIKIACDHLFGAFSWHFLEFQNSFFFSVSPIPVLQHPLPVHSIFHALPCLAARFYESQFPFSISRFCPCATNRLLPFLTFFPFFPFPYFAVFISDEHFAGSVLARLNTRSPPLHSGVGQPLSYRPFLKIQSRLLFFFVSFLDSFLQTPSSFLLNPSSYHTLPVYISVLQSPSN